MREKKNQNKTKKTKQRKSTNQITVAIDKYFNGKKFN